MTKTPPTTNSWQERPLTILGLSRSGIAVADYILKRGGNVVLSEVLPATPTNEPQRTRLQELGCTLEMGGHTKQVYTHSPLVVVSPGIPPSSPVINQLRISGVEIISEVELAFRENETGPGATWIGITGTNGKTTTTTLLANILQAAGKKAPACGNIGQPIIDCLDSEPDTLVAELSSFQLEFSPTLKAHTAIFLNLVPDHLNWHGSLEAYKRAKLRLFTGEQSPEWVILNADDPLSKLVQENTTGQLFWFSRSEASVEGQENAIFVNADSNLVLATTDQDKQILFNVSELQLIGQHNQDNVMAAIAAAVLQGVAIDTICKACLEFSGVEHRLERVTTLQTANGTVDVYNDSKATNTDACLSALSAFENPVILIAGGRDKNEPLEALADAAKKRASAVVLIGEAQTRFGDAFKSANYPHVHFADSLEQALRQALELSQGEPVLFSPACASFDQYKNFEERGLAFKGFVYNIKEEMEHHQTTTA